MGRCKENQGKKMYEQNVTIKIKTCKPKKKQKGILELFEKHN